MESSVQNFWTFIVIRVCLIFADMALTLFSRGKGDNYRLGHGTEEHVRLPKQIDRFNGKKVKDISVGSMHCLAVTEDGEVYGWGRNDQGQLGDMTIQSRPEPTSLPGLDGKNIVGAACGPSQVMMTKPTKWHVRSAKTLISLGIPQSDQSLCCPHEESLGS